MHSSVLGIKETSGLDSFLKIVQEACAKRLQGRAPEREEFPPDMCEHH